VDALRRASLLTALVGGLLVALAGPAAAVPAGWSDPPAVSGLTVLWLLVGIPVGLFALVVLMVYLPPLARGERIAPGSGQLEDQWIGGPRHGTKELAAPDTDESEAGGARGAW
jgi:hypothetical protein